MSADIERWDPPNDPTAFESLCLDLWRDIWQDSAQKNGRSGQPQAGIDVFGQHLGKWIGVQCKQKDGLLRRRVTARELDEEVAAAKRFDPPLFGFILATTGPRDAAVQQRARALTEEHRKQGLFTVEIWSWDDIWPELYRREPLLKQIAPLYWPRLSGMYASKPTATSASKDLPIPPELKERMERARVARRRHDFPLAQQLWDEIHALADQLNDRRISVRARLEKASLQLQDEFEPDEALKSAEGCLNDLTNIDLGRQRARVLQLMGEIHRHKRNSDQARGFLNSALDCARSEGDRCVEGWVLLTLVALDQTRGTDPEEGSRLDLIRQAYDCFSAVYAAGDEGSLRQARDGFAACHSWRAEVYDRTRLDDAMAEYARALELYREMGEDSEWDVADTLFLRGELHARADDPALAGKDLEAAFDLFTKRKDHYMRAKCALAIAELFDQRGLRIESKKYFKGAALIASVQNNPKRAAWFWFRYAGKLGELHEFEEANAIYQKLLAEGWLASGQRLDILRMFCLTAKATGHDEDLERYSGEVLDILDEQITLAKSAGERRRLILSKGHSLQDLEQHDRALACYRRGLEAFEAVKDRDGLIESWWCIAQLMGQTKRRNEEREAYGKILSLVGDHRDTFFLPMTLAMLAQMDITEERFDEARRHLERAERETDEERPNPVVILLLAELRDRLPARPPE